MPGVVERADDRLAATELDDRHGAQVHRPHPEALEGQVEEGQQGDLEDPVVADDDRPRVVGRRLPVARDEITARFGPTLATWRRRPTEAWAPGGESLAQVQARVRPALASVLEALAAAGTPGTRDAQPRQVPGYGEPPARHPWSIIVGHDGVFKVALLTLFDLPLERFWMWSMDLCAVSVIELRGGQPVIRAFNHTGHLAPLLDEAAVEAQEARSRSGAL